MHCVIDPTIQYDEYEKIEFPKSKERVNVSREDFVAKYVGWSTDKTLKLLNNNKNKLLYIENAETLRHNDNDIFGDEALLTIRMFMIEHPGEIDIICEMRGELLSFRTFVRAIMK